MATGNPQLDAILEAIGRADQSFAEGQQRLAPGQFAGGAFGQTALNFLQSPAGFDPAAVEAMKAEAAQTLAGNVAAQQDQLKAYAGAQGAGGSNAAARLSSEIQSMGARDLLSAIRQITMAQEQAKMQQRGIGASLGGQTLGLEAGMNQAAAGAHFGRQHPIVPQQGQYRYIDPQTGRVTYPGPWTQQDMEAMQAERMRWEQQNTGGT